MNKPQSLRIYLPDEHQIDQKLICTDALGIVKVLKRNGFDAYLVGGAVRDLILGTQPRDFDIVTNADFSELSQLFDDCRQVNLRFALTFVQIQNKGFEITTYRQDPAQANPEGQGFKMGEHYYLHAHKDALQRDFTINALYLCPVTLQLYDFVGGVEDAQKSLLRVIGEPEIRYSEEPLCMFRTMRLIAKTGLSLAPDCAVVLPELAAKVKTIPPQVILNEFPALFLSGKAEQTAELMLEYDLFSQLLPDVDQFVQDNPSHLVQLKQLLGGIDTALARKRNISPPLMLAALLWLPLRRQIMQQKAQSPDQIQRIAQDILTNQQANIAIPDNIVAIVKELWQLQFAFDSKQDKDIQQHKNFNAAYVLLLLRTKFEGSSTIKLAQRWQAQLMSGSNVTASA